MGRQTNNLTNDLRQTSQSSRQLLTLSINTTVNMKYSIAFAVGAALVAAQDISEVPACGQMCITNMLGVASSFGCTGPTDLACLCGDPRFGYGLRDCTIEACGEDVFSAVQTYGNSVCAAAGVTTISSGGSAVATSTIGSTTMYSIAGAVAGGVGSLSGSASEAAASASAAVSSLAASASDASASASGAIASASDAAS